MVSMSYKNVTKEDVKVLERQGCSTQDWSLVKVAEGFKPGRVKNVQFLGRVNIGRLAGEIRTASGLTKPAGIYNAAIADCTIGDDVRICNVGVHISNYEIGAGACIENVGKMETSAGALFGNGVEVAAVNEAGGREVIIFNELSVQFAYLMCLHRYRPKLIRRLAEIAKREVEKVRADRGKVGAGAQIFSTTEIIDVNIGQCAIVNGAACLINGTILSSTEAATTVGANVSAEDFIIAEGSSVTEAVNLKKVFVGQGCQIGKQFSAENSLFFANCEAFHGEACSIFAGPYTVTHHKSTLLIACLYSFYNAGSGSNQSNHMYKLGPAHEGKLERGTKTGSFSYMMWPCRVGPFSVVLGKHTRNFDTSDFPFTHLEAGPTGRCIMVPGLHLVTVGTMRDAKKWPSRDRRKGSKRRDIISFDVLSPYTIGKMLKGCSILKELYDKTNKTVEDVTIKGAQMKRVLLRTSQRFYRTGIEMYLLEKVLSRAEKSLDGGVEKIQKSFAADGDSVYSSQWTDIGGQLMPLQRLLDVTAAIEKGEIDDIDTFGKVMGEIYQASEKDEWHFVKDTYKQIFEEDLESMTEEGLVQMAESYQKVKGKFLKQVLVDAEKEFGDLSRTGFGHDGAAEDLDEDFHRVRGRYNDNKFVREMRANLEAVERRVSDFKEKLLQSIKAKRR